MGYIWELRLHLWNSTRYMRTHLKDLQLRYGDLGMGMDRFSVLLGALDPSIDDIKQIVDHLVVNFNNCIQEVSAVTIDESVIRYQPSAKVKREAELQGEPIPVVFIKRKPHPNGLLLNQALTMVRNPFNEQSPLPFILDMIPHLTFGDSSPTEAFEKIIDRWSRDERPHFVADAAFGNRFLLQ